MDRKGSARRLRALGSVLCLVLLTRNGAAQDCSRNFVGLLPLDDLGPATYLGSPGGLYPGGVNQRPTGHEREALRILEQDLAPLDASGAMDPVNGRIGFAALGMSITFDDFNAFIPATLGDPDLNPRLTLANGAQPGVLIEQWADPNDPAWSAFATALNTAGIAAPQLQVVWMKHAVGQLSSSWPEQGILAADRHVQVLQILKARYPNVRLVLLSSRIYGDYSVTESPEPFAYETGFAVKWLVQRQIDGDPALAFRGAGAVVPWIDWGPYLWADGEGADRMVGGKPGRSDGLEWECTDYQPDGVHLNSKGSAKNVQMLTDFLQQEVTGAPWFRAFALVVEQGSQAPAASQSVRRGDLQVVAGQVDAFVPLASGKVQVDSVTLSASGAARDDRVLAAVELYQDTDQDGLVDGGSAPLSSGTITQDNGSLVMALNPPLVLDAGEKVTLLVTVDLTGPDQSAALGFAFLLWVLLAWMLRRRLRRGLTGPVLAMALAVLVAACGGGGGGGAAASVRLQVDAVQATGLGGTTSNVYVGGLPQPGSRLTIRG